MKAKLSSCAKTSIWSISLLGFLCVVIAGAILGVFPSMFAEKVREGLLLREGNEAAERFANPPVAGFLKFNVFNVTNYADINSGKDVKPILSECGPYYFKQIKTKVIEDWEFSHTFVTYKVKTKYIFDSASSKGSLSDKIYHINAPDYGIVSYLVSANRPDLLRYLYNSKVLDYHQVGELLFDGYRVKFLDLITSLAGIIGIEVPKILENNTFGVFYGKNDSLDLQQVVFTGVSDIKKYTNLFMYDGSSKLPYWRKGSHCNDLNGTDGQQYPPGVTDKDTLYVFNGDLCRSLNFEYKSKVTVHGIDALRFEIPDSVFEDSAINKDNACFFKEGVPHPKSGVLPLGHSCRPNQPIAMSAPHFFQGADEYTNAFEGLKKDADLHKTFIDVEPLTGQVVRGRKRLQVNIEVPIVPEEHKTIPFLKFSKPGYFPLLWLEEGGDIDEAKASEFKKTIINPKQTVHWTLIALIAIGIVAILLAMGVYFMKK